jgi:YegS/Rv2252/BmrU family lipid kinase
MASRSNGEADWLALEERFHRSFPNASVEVISTQSPEHTVKLGEELQTDLIVSVSGDGTLHNITQGLMRRERTDRPALTVVPVGTGNDFARSAGIPLDPSQAVSAISTGVLRTIDIGRCNDRYYLNTLSFGVDAAIGLRTAELAREQRRGGAILYALTAVRTVITELHPHSCRMHIDGQDAGQDMARDIEKELLICAVQNGPYYGGGFMPAPDARLDDGLLDVCMIGRISIPKALYYLARMRQGSHQQLKAFTSLRARSLTIDFTTTIPCQCDGEPLDAQHFEIEVIPQALNILAPLAPLAAARHS